MGLALFSHKLIFEKMLEYQRITSRHHNIMKSYKNLIGGTSENMQGKRKRKSKECGNKRKHTKKQHDIVAKTSINKLGKSNFKQKKFKK
jgi:hypothetical protein